MGERTIYVPCELRGDSLVIRRCVNCGALPVAVQDRVQGVLSCFCVPKTSRDAQIVPLENTGASPASSALPTPFEGGASKTAGPESTRRLSSGKGADTRPTDPQTPASSASDRGAE